jgi:hypothetical protein
MLKNTFQLSSKMKISVDPQKLESFSQSHVKFYLKYSSFVFRALKKPSFQFFLRWMLKKEKALLENVTLPKEESGFTQKQ